MTIRFPGNSWPPVAGGNPDARRPDAHDAAREFARQAGSMAGMIIVSGRVLCQWGDVAKRVNVHSIRKSLLNALYGLHVDAGTIDLSATLGDLGVDDIGPALSDAEKRATILDLLRSRSGVYHPAAYETPEMKAARPARGAHRAGTFWYYNNWDFNVLGAVFERITATKIFDEFARRIAAPIGMQDFSPGDGRYEFGEESLYPAYPVRLSARDMARFGLLYLARGSWASIRLLSDGWVARSASAYSAGGEEGAYGLLWWTENGGRFLGLDGFPVGTFAALGTRGNGIVVVPAHDLVLVNAIDTDQPGSRMSWPQVGRLVKLALTACRSGNGATGRVGSRRVTRGASSAPERTGAAPAAEQGFLGVAMNRAMPTVMTAVVLKGHGGFEQLECRDDVPVPKPLAGEVLVRIGAAGVNNTDINTRTAWYSRSVTDGTTADAAALGHADARAADSGWTGDALRFPRIQGADACGRIVAAGDGVDAARIGERVLIEPVFVPPPGTDRFKSIYFGSECDGGFAQFAAVPAAHAHRIDSVLSDAELASFPCAYSAAENMLTRANLRAGETVLITGASGGVGSAAVQLSRRRGATVVAIAAASKSDAVAGLGAARVIARDADPAQILGVESVDVVIDVVGGPQFPSLLQVMRRGGRYAVAGAISGPTVCLDLRTLYLKDLRLLGCTVLEPEVFPNLVRYIERGEIRPLVAMKFALHDIIAAQREFLTKRHLGKIVLEIPGPRS